MHQHNPHIALSVLVESVARAARALLVLDAGQPEAVRVGAITMPAERLFWTLTQLDDGLDLDTCQMLVRASRLCDGRCAVPVRWSDELIAADVAVRTAVTWLRRRWATMPDMTALVAWFARDDRMEELPGTDSSVLEHRVPVETLAASVLVAAGSVTPLPLVPANWLDHPPVVGPPSGTVGLWGLTPGPLIPAAGAGAGDRTPAGRLAWRCLLGLLVVVGAAVSGAAGAWDLTLALALAGGVAALRGLPRLAQPGW